MVISFSVINYVVNEASSRERRSLILFYIPLKMRQKKLTVTPSQAMTVRE